MTIRSAKTNRTVGAFFVALFFSCAALAQSNDANFPTPVTSSVVSGTIKARDIGDSRLTTFYYAFGGEQGDIFVNVTTKNFAGDIDIFAADAMRTLTKMVIYADFNVSETGRLIYLRKPEKLVLRIQGRSPDDEAATFQIKFGGSFIALKGKSSEDSGAPTVESDETGKVRVNSVGTIIETPKIEKPVAKIEEPVVPAETEPVPVSPKPATKKPSRKKPAKVAVVVTENAGDKVGNEKTQTIKRTTGRKTRKPAKTTEPLPDPLANVRLVIALKNGEILERPLSEVLKFSVDKGTLTVIAKDGTIRRFSIIDVAKVTIE